mgnify:FL=1
MFKTRAPFTKNDFVQNISVSRETLKNLSRYSNLVKQWQEQINLVGPSTLTDIWCRHMLDSAQLSNFIDEKSAKIVDLGSGAGFPGLVLSIMGFSDVVLIESNKKKSRFLNEVICETNCTAVVYNGRIEDYKNEGDFDYIIARALAPLDRLIKLSLPLNRGESRCLFLKGRNYEQELTQAEKKWSMDVQIHKSLSFTLTFSAEKEFHGVVLEIDKLRPKGN